MVATLTQLYTAEDLFVMPRDCGKYELSQGELIPMSPAAFNSGRYARRIVGPLGDFVDEHELGDCGVPESGFVLSRNPDTVREPDVWFVTRGCLPSAEAGERFFEGAPDLAVEIISPSDRFDDVMRKAKEYLQAGTRLLWLLEPGTRLALVFRAGGGTTWVDGSGADESGSLEGEDVIPGFSLPLSRIFR